MSIHTEITTESGYVIDVFDGVGGKLHMKVEGGTDETTEAGMASVALTPAETMQLGMALMAMYQGSLHQGGEPTEGA
jgi:hypothetical protein